MSERERLNWEKTRRRGAFLFGLTWAALGALTCVFVVAGEFFIFNLPLNRSTLIEKVSAFILVSITTGALEWRSNEKRYAESQPPDSRLSGTLNGSQHLATRDVNGSH